MKCNKDIKKTICERVYCTIPLKSYILLAKKVRDEIATHSALPVGTIVHECKGIGTFFNVTLSGKPWDSISSARLIEINVSSNLENFYASTHLLPSELPKNKKGKYHKNLNDVISELLRLSTISSFADIINEYTIS